MALVTFMTPEKAKTILDFLLPTLQSEVKTTAKVIAATPAGHEDYKPSDRCMSALTLAWHTASADVWFLNSLIDGKFEPSGGGMPEAIKTVSDVSAWYDANIGPAVARVAAASPEQLAAPVSFFGVMEWPAIGYVNFSMLHTAHHRGQLSSYLRPMGGKVPSIYGGSADEPMK